MALLASASLFGICILHSVSALSPWVFLAIVTDVFVGVFWGGQGAALCAMWNLSSPTRD